MRVVRIILFIVGGLLAFSGTVWALQGMGYLPGTFMRNNPDWIRNGAIAVVVGLGLIYAGRRMGQKPTG